MLDIWQCFKIVHRDARAKWMANIKRSTEKKEALGMH